MGHLCDCARIYAACDPTSGRRGVKCIEHGHLIDEPTAKLLAEKGIWWSLQPLTYDAEVFARMPPVSQKKALQVFAGTENAYKLAKQYKVKTAWGADILFDAGACSRQGAYLAQMVRWYTPAEALKMATADNGELMALSGLSIPIPASLVSWKRVRSQICCWLTAIHWKTSSSSKTPTKTL